MTRPAPGPDEPPRTDREPTAGQQYAWPSPGPTAPPHGAAAGAGFATHQASSATYQPGPVSPGPQRSTRRRGWGMIAGTAAVAAMLASGGTAVLTGAFAPQPGTGTAPVPAAGSEIVQADDATSPAWRTVAQEVRGSVVALDVATPRGQAAGSGVILDDDGNILTNAHVIAEASDGEVTVTLADGRMLRAGVVGADPTTDLAVVRLVDAPNDLEPATLGSSAKLSVGDPVLAVGNPLGLDSTVTTGIISALDRPVVTRAAERDDTVVTNAIQIDAAINPGNSGGPLFDAAGRVIGINSSIASLSGGSEAGSIGLGFAIPVDQAQGVSQQLINEGRAQHAFLGVALSDSTATADDITRKGTKVERVESGSPAADAGLQTGDIITAIDDAGVDSAASLTGYVRQHDSDDSVILDVVRAGSATSIDVTLAAREDPGA